MKRISEFIKELESLKEKYGDLPVVTADGTCSECIHEDDSSAAFYEKGAWNHKDRLHHDCIIIV